MALKRSMTLLWLYYAKNKNSSKTVAWVYKAVIQDHGRAQKPAWYNA
jgi:hypothetical protein